MSESKPSITTETASTTDTSRRDFLRKSAYAAYATPVIVALLVDKASAAQSWNKGRGNLDHPGTGNGGINYPFPQNLKKTLTASPWYSA